MKSEREWCELKYNSLILCGLQISEELEWNSIDLQGDLKSMQWISFANVWRRRSKRKWEFLMLKFVFRGLYIVVEETCLLVKRWREMSLHLKFEILKTASMLTCPSNPCRHGCVAKWTATLISVANFQHFKLPYICGFLWFGWGQWLMIFKYNCHEIFNKIF